MSPRIFEIRPLTAGDREELSAFSCGAGSSEPWVLAAEELVRLLLADALEAGSAQALGAFDGAKLAAVIAWRPNNIDPTLWNSAVLAVRVGYYRRGLGRRLKEDVLSLAHRSGIEAVVSFVHIDNEPMYQLNRKLGASAKRLDGDPTHFVMTIPTADVR